MSKFPSARLKIERAYTHIDELQAVADWYCVPQLHEPIAQYDPSTGTAQLTFQPEPIPPHVALIFGDAIHCLRVSLDHAAQVLVSGKAEKKLIDFPFGDTFESLEASIKGRAIKFAAPEALEAIKNEIRPYQFCEDTGEKGNSPLWMMNKIDNIDKHREILIAMSRVRYQPNYFSVREYREPVLKMGKDGKISTVGPGIVVESDTTTSMQIIIGEEDFFKGEPIIPTLHQLAELTSSAIDILEPFG